jgi:flavin reductase (DIM6/NTAB) family NADH-FMN oxidoreductase RutF
MTNATLVSQPEKYWDRLFAPGGHCGIVTTVDKDGRVNAASYATCVRIVHNPVQIAVTTNPAGHTAENLLATGSFVVNLPQFERDILERCAWSDCRSRAASVNWRRRGSRRCHRHGSSRLASPNAYGISNARWSGPRNGSNA